MADQSFDVVVVGAGPGGYVAAIRASQLGKKVAIVEREHLGGICLNWGCIPSKNLIHQADVFNSLEHMAAVGVSIDRETLDYALVQQRSRKVVKTLTSGVAGLLKRNKVEYLTGEAKLVSATEVLVDEQQSLQAKKIIVATGSRPMHVPGFEFDEDRVLSSTGILALETLPESLVILGAGAIGCEFAYVMNSFGVKVILVEALDHLLPTEDVDVCAVLENSFSKSGIAVHTSTRASVLSRYSDHVTVSLTSADGQSTEVSAERALVVFGRSPNTQSLGLEAVGVSLDKRGFIPVGDYGQTNTPGIYAIGDVTTTPALAHVASAEGELVVEHIAGIKTGPKAIDPALVPSAIYCEPQVAGFGLREQSAERAGDAFKTFSFPYHGAGKSIAIEKPEGLVKVICDAKTDEILGAHVVGHDATELIHEILLAKSAELLPEDIATMVHAHPTLSEATMEAMRGIYSQPIHG